MRVAYITAGAASMYCGSCIHDNALAAALSRRDADVALIPTYTPLRTDEENVALDRVFYGGVNIFLQQQWSFFRRTHRLFDRVLDSPFLIRTLARFGSSPGEGKQRVTSPPFYSDKQQFCDLFVG